VPKVFRGSFTNPSPGHAENAEHRKALYADIEAVAASMIYPDVDGEVKERQQPPGNRQPRKVVRTRFFERRRNDKLRQSAISTGATAHPDFAPDARAARPAPRGRQEMVAAAMRRNGVIPRAPAPAA
jgi:hypothetical protein